MPTHNGTSEFVRMALSSGAAYGVRELTEAVTALGAAGATENGVRRVLDQRCAVGEFLKERENGVLVYRLNPDWAGARKGPAPRATDQAKVDAVVQAIETAAAPAARPLAAGLGLSLGSPAQKARERDLDAAVRALFEERLDDESAYSPQDVASELEGAWPAKTVAIALYEGVQQGWLRMEYSVEGGVNVFSRVLDADADADAVPAAAPAPTPARAVPAVEPEVGAILRQAGIGDVEAIPAAPRALSPGALSERITAICSDIEDALGDACDHHAPHNLIKALVVASGAAHRALRELAV